jgi:hypothetical protein
MTAQRQSDILKIEQRRDLLLKIGVLDNEIAFPALALIRRGVGLVIGWV